MQGRLARSAFAAWRTPILTSSLWIAARLSQTRSTAVKRPSRRRYSASNTRGRVGQAKDLLEVMKTKPREEAKAFYDSLLPRDKLDVMRLLHEKRRKRRNDRSSSALPTYYSALFERSYLFKEEDVTEESTLGRGPGGQATNRRMQTAILHHIPSGIIVKFSRFPSLWLNRRAARELLNLRLEEHLLGPASRLGKARVAKEKRRRRRQLTVAYLTKKGSRLQVREAQECHWAAFLEGTLPLPESATQKMGIRPTSHDAPVTLALLFGAECNSWWPKLCAAVESAAIPASEGSNKTTNATTAVHAQVPQMLRYLFPATYADANKAEREQLARCRASKAARANVARAFVCFCELFGLRLRDAAHPSASSQQQRLLQKDGLNWVEYRSRMSQHGQLTLVARVCWPHVYVSLRELDMLAEARAIVVFLKKEARAAGPAESKAWTQEALKCLAQAVRDSKSSAPQDGRAEGAAPYNSDTASTRTVNVSSNGDAVHM